MDRTDMLTDYGILRAEEGAALAEQRFEPLMLSSTDFDDSETGYSACFGHFNHFFIHV